MTEKIYFFEAPIITYLNNHVLNHKDNFNTLKGQ